MLMPHDPFKNNKNQHLSQSTLNLKKNNVSPLISPLYTFNTLNEKQISNVLNHSMTKEQLKMFVSYSTNAQLLFQPIIMAIQDVYSLTNHSFTVSQLVFVLQNGKFYRFLNKKNEILINLNEKSIQSQKKCLIASIFCYFTQTLKLSQIEKILKVFHLQECYYSSSPYGIPLDLSKIIKILKKVGRVIKSIDFKAWFNDFKAMIKSQYVDNYHFLYLVTMTEPKQSLSQNYFSLSSIGKMKEKGGLQKQKIHNKKEFKELSQENKRSFSETNFRIQGLKPNIFFSIKTSISEKQNFYLQIKKKLTYSNINLKERKKAWSVSQKLNKILQNQQNQSKNKFIQIQSKNKTITKMNKQHSSSIKNLKNIKKSDYQTYCQNTEKEFNRLLVSELKKVSQIINNNNSKNILRL